MSKFKYYIYKGLSMIKGNRCMVDYYRKCGISIGEETHVFSKLVSAEPYLISIGNHCTVATNVTFLTHDACIGALRDRKQASDLCGPITIGNHCFIGSGAILLYGVSIADGCVVAAGSVVTKSVTTPNVIIGGNPAKIIGNTDDFIKKYEHSFLALHGLSPEERKNKILEDPNKLINR